MLLEITKLAVGLLIAYFHRQIADYINQQEQVFILLLKQRGVAVPVLTEAFARNVYFSLGIFVATYQMTRIWSLLHS